MSAATFRNWQLPRPVAFVRALPAGTPLPGCLSLSVGSAGRLAFAWIDGQDRGHGADHFDGQSSRTGFSNASSGSWDTGTDRSAGENRGRAGGRPSNSHPAEGDGSGVGRARSADRGRPTMVRIGERRYQWRQEQWVRASASRRGPGPESVAEELERLRSLASSSKGEADAGAVARARGEPRRSSASCKRLMAQVRHAR